MEAWAIGFFATVGLPIGCNGQTDPEDAERTRTADQGQDDDVRGDGDADSGRTPSTGSTPGDNPSTGNAPMPDPPAPGTGTPVPLVPATPTRTDEGFFACANPKPALDFEGEPSNLIECDRGMLQRAKALDCPSRIPEYPEVEIVDAGASHFDAGVEGPPTAGHPVGECTTDADCTRNRYGHCQPDSLYGSFCAYGCVADSDCAEGNACLCEDPVGRCVPSQCTTNADCTNGAACTAVFGWDCSYNVIVSGFECQGTGDACGGPGDCEGENAACLAPSYSGTESRTCDVPRFDCGRPFVVEGKARMAETRTAEWSRTKLAFDLPDDANVRARLARHWTHIGVMEHASIAAFARFSLQLLSLGAPAQLVEQSNQALADELSHAELAFALASAYEGNDVAPGPLSMLGALAGASLHDVLELVVIEGCVGETIAALEAREGAAHASDPAIRTALERVADDETRHAALAWRALRWGLAQGDGSTFERVEQAFERGLASQPVEPQPELDDLTRHGVLSSTLRAELREQARAVLRSGLSSLRAQRQRRERAA